MNQSTISLSRLSNIANPFEQEIFGLTVEKVNQALDNLDIFPVPGEANHVREVAYRVANYHHYKALPIAVDLDLAQNEQWPIVGLESLYRLAAAIVRDEKEVQIEARGELALSLFGVQPVTEFSAENLTEKKTLNISWAINENTAWHDIDYILEKLQDNYSGYNAKELYRYIPLSILNDADFLEKAQSISRQFIHNMDFKLLQQPGIWQFMLDNMDHLPLEKIARKLGYTDKSDNFNKQVLTDILSVPEKALKVMKFDSNGYLLPFYPEEILHSKTFLNTMYSVFEQGMRADRLHFDKNLAKLFSAQFFQDEDNLKEFIVRGMPLGFRPYENPQVYQHWIGNREKVLEYIALAGPENKNFFSLYNYLPKDLKHDKEIVKAFMQGYPKLYTDLPMRLRRDNEITWLYMKEEYPEWNKVPLDTIFGEKDPLRIQYYLKKHSSFLVEPSCPPAWKDNLETLLNLPEMWGYLHSEISEENKAKLFENADFCLKLVHSNRENYAMLPLKMKENIQVALEYLRMNGLDEGVLPSRLWANHDFCLSALAKNPSYHYELFTHYIPRAFWQDKVFMADFFKRLDNYEMEEIVLDILPKEIKLFVDEMKMKRGEYLNIFEKHMLHQEFEQTLEKKEIRSKKVKL